MSLARAKIALFGAALAGSCLLSTGFGCTARKEMKPSAAQEIAGDEERLAELLQIEGRGDADAITAQDLGHRHVVVRRASAKALARIGDLRARPKLLSLLSDEDAEVMAFAAHGLGWLCETEGGKARETTAALVARSVSLSPAPAGSPFEPIFAISRALATCTTAEGERTLALWLSSPAPWNGSAALALGALASRTKELSEPTQKALLDAAIADPPLDEALLALGKLERVAVSLREGLLEASRARLPRKGPNRLFAVRALGRAGAEAAADLERVLLASEGDFDAAERVEAAKALARLGAAGERALAGALASSLPGEGSTSLATDAFGPLLTTVEMLRGAEPSLRERLRNLSRLPIPQAAKPSIERRVMLLRCAAARKLKDAKVKDVVLAGCDRESPPSAVENAKLDIAKPASPPPVTKAVKLTFVTDAGQASMTLDPKLAPFSVARFVELARGGHYDGAPLRLVVPGSFVQIGPASEGGRTPLPRETAPLAFEAFDVGVALDRGKETGSDELFVTLGRHPELDGQYTWLGRAEPSFAKLAEGDVIERVIVEEP